DPDVRTGVSDARRKKKGSGREVRSLFRLSALSAFSARRDRRIVSAHPQSIAVQRILGFDYKRADGAPVGRFVMHLSAVHGAIHR
ncbi:hypothetical protein, partial [Stutzerimonas nitrititolerans]|uniref:hypothetical protein n=1 Tax=Stutzerimonas nitrititolerans TaxID=2482751 RepID=UPI0028AD620F